MALTEMDFASGGDLSETILWEDTSLANQGYTEFNLSQSIDNFKYIKIKAVLSSNTSSIETTVMWDISTVKNWTKTKAGTADDNPFGAIGTKNGNTYYYRFFRYISSTELAISEYHSQNACLITHIYGLR